MSVQEPFRCASRGMRDFRTDPFNAAYEPGCAGRIIASYYAGTFAWRTDFAAATTARIHCVGWPDGLLQAG
jgi:hypothetical protein